MHIVKDYIEEIETAVRGMGKKSRCSLW